MEEQLVLTNRFAVRPTLLFLQVLLILVAERVPGHTIGNGALMEQIPGLLWQ
jgi:hypothetical protein